MGGSYRTQEIKNRRDKHESDAHIEQVDAPVIAPEDEQRSQHGDWTCDREQAASELAVPIPGLSIYQERKHCQTGEQLTEQEAFLLPKEAKADRGAQRPESRKTASAGHCRDQCTEATCFVQNARDTHAFFLNLRDIFCGV